jgi:hypothetical protein
MASTILDNGGGLLTTMAMAVSPKAAEEFLHGDPF